MEAAAKMLSMDVTSGLIALAAALAVATALGLVLRWRAGRFRGTGLRSPAQATPSARGGPSGQAAASAQGGPVAGPDVLTEADLGGRLGRQATLVQFSTAFCAPCRPTRQILAQVAEMTEGVTHLEIDAATRLDLVRRLRINSTPTVLVLGPDGSIVKRAAGLPRKADVIAALGTAIEPAAAEITPP